MDNLKNVITFSFIGLSGMLLGVILLLIKFQLECEMKLEVETAKRKLLKCEVTDAAKVDEINAALINPTRQKLLSDLEISGGTIIGLSFLLGFIGVAYNVVSRRSSRT
jgi:hypothetical protein